MPKLEFRDEDTGKKVIVEDDGTITDEHGNIIPDVSNIKEAIEWSKKQKEEK